MTPLLWKTSIHLWLWWDPQAGGTFFKFLLFFFIIVVGMFQNADEDSPWDACHWRIFTHIMSLFSAAHRNPTHLDSRQNICFSSPHGGARDKNICRAREQHASSWAQVSWTGWGCAYFNASARQRGADVAGWVASTLCCSSQWAVGSASSKQCGEMSRCPHVVAAWAVKLREWALWLAGSSFPFMDNKCHHKIKTVTKRRLCTIQDSLSRRLKATHVMHQLGDPLGFLFFSCRSGNCQVHTHLWPPTQKCFVWNDPPHTNVQTNTHTRSHTGIASINKRDNNERICSPSAALFATVQPSTTDTVTHALNCKRPSAAKNVFLICRGAGWSNVFAWMGVLVSLYWLHLLYTDTHSHAIHTYESSFISWLSVLAIFLGGAGLSDSPCSCSLFFAAFCDSNRVWCELSANGTHFERWTISKK